MTPNLTHEAESFMSLLWQHIYQRVRGMLHPHHFEHEPGGKDEVDLPLGFLSNVTLTTPSNGQTLVYNSTLKKWINGAGGGAGSAHQVHFSVALPVTVIAPGPTNITGATLTITAVNFSSDGEVSGSISPGGSFNFAAGGGSSRTDDLTISWTDGTTMTLTITDQGIDGTYLAIDVAAG